MLPFVAVATNDRGGWPVATLLAGAPGFITSPDAQHLTIASLPDPIDPIAPLLVAGAPFILKTPSTFASRSVTATVTG